MIYAVVTVSAIFFLWWLAGSLFNRRRSADLVKAVREALPALGEGAGIRWFGSGAFQIDLSKPAAEFTRVQVVGLLEPRDIPLVWLYWRLRGRRDRLVVQADFRRPPRAGVSPATVPPWLAELTLQRSSPHLHLTAQVPPGGEAAIDEAFRLADELAEGRKMAPES